MSDSKKEQMINFWSERARLYESDPRANTNDVWLREVEIAYVDRVLKEGRFGNVMDFGCANGYTTSRLAKSNPNVKFLGVDINPDMIDVARTFPITEGLTKLDFRLADVLRGDVNETFHCIFTIRVFQNVESVEIQKRIFDKLYDLIDPRGALLYVESYAAGYTRINDDRVRLGLTPLPIHPHLTLLTDEFDEHVASRMELIKEDYLSSSYYLITRLLYSYIAKMNNEPIDYNHPIHQVASMVPQVGEYGVQKARLYRKR